MDGSTSTGLSPRSPATSREIFFFFPLEGDTSTSAGCALRRKGPLSAADRLAAAAAVPARICATSPILTTRKGCALQFYIRSKRWHLQSTQGRGRKNCRTELQFSDSWTTSICEIPMRQPAHAHRRLSGERMRACRQLQLRNLAAEQFS